MEHNSETLVSAPSGNVSVSISYYRDDVLQWHKSANPQGEKGLQDTVLPSWAKAIRQVYFFIAFNLFFQLFSSDCNFYSQSLVSAIIL